MIKKSLRQLNSRQIGLVKSPKKRYEIKGKIQYKTRDGVSDNFDGIYYQTSNCFSYLNSVAQLLPYFEEYSNYTKAKEIVDLFSLDKFDPIFKQIFPEKEDEGASISDSILFDPDAITGNKIALALHMVKFGSQYLRGAFSKGQKDIFQNRIEPLVSEIEGLITAFDEIKKLHKENAELREHVSTAGPVKITGRRDSYTVMCRVCKVYDFGKNLIEAVQNVKHKPKCKYHHDTSKLNKDKIVLWFEIIPPGQDDRFRFLRLDEEREAKITNTPSGS